jgi:hypothetical protein
MAIHRMPRQGIPGGVPEPVDYQARYEQESVQLPMSPNIGLAAGLVLALASIFGLIVYYVL